MKKIAFLVVAAMVAMVTFTACEDEDKDQKLIDDIRKIKNYVGSDSDGDAVEATFSDVTFSILYVDEEFGGLTISGTWTVQNEQLILGPAVAGWLPGTILDKGKKLVFGDGSIQYTLTNK